MTLRRWRRCRQRSSLHAGWKCTATVRHIFTRYVALASGQALVDELRAQGYRTKQRAYADGGIKGGIAFGRGMLFHLLQNRLYNGEVEHKGSVYAGEHDAIVDRGVWNAVQQLIAGNRIERKVRNNASAPSLLSGLVVDGDGRRMSPSHAVKSGRRYRYYITHSSTITDDKAAWRMPAHPLERAVIDQLAAWLGDRQAIATIVATADAAATACALASAEVAVKLLHGSMSARRELIVSIVGVIRLSDSDLQIHLKADALAGMLRVAIVDDAALTISAPLARVRRGKEIKLVIGNPAGGDAQSGCNERLVALLTEARKARETLLAHADRSLTAHATATGQCRKRLGQLVGLSYLAPGIQRAIMTGRQRATITPNALLRARVSIVWDEQKAMLGLPDRHLLKRSGINALETPACSAACRLERRSLATSQAKDVLQEPPENGRHSARLLALAKSPVIR